MPQMLLPIFPAGVTHISPSLAFEKKDGYVTYFNALMPVFRHRENDIQSFKMIISQFYVIGVVKQAGIARVFGIKKLFIKRAVKLFREHGPQGFFFEKKCRGPAVLTPPVLENAQTLLDEGFPPAEVARRLELKVDTVRKAILHGRLHRPEHSAQASHNLPALKNVSSKSDRSAEDSNAAMGVAATNVVDRLMASIGMGCEDGVTPQFSPALDVTKGGVLFALPALLAMGLLRYTDEHFSLPRGFYRLASIFLLLGFMALSRIKSLERLRYHSPGEWGKLLGLDRVPEVRTLREKVKILAEQGQPIPWSAALCRDWMEGAPLQAQTLYVDGHVRVYHGKQTALPKHYVSRQRLCLRATVDYWVNAMDGQPFFVVHQDVDPGLIQVLENEIFPRLEHEVPGQPSSAELEANPLLHRFTVVFDREGYSPKLMLRARQIRIACLTYRKRPGEDWPSDEFSQHEVRLVGGEIVTMLLAERGVLLGGVVWVREFRRLTESGHQTSIVATDYCTAMPQLAAAMFARWSQENFFAYMRQNYGLDRLITYGTESIPDTTPVINPEYRRLDGEIRKKNSRLNRVKAQFGDISLEGTIEAGKVEAYQQKKAEFQLEAEHLGEEVSQLKAERKKVKRHITYGELPEEAQFDRLSVASKHMIDTIKMIAYRAETAEAQILREKLSRNDDARALLCSIYNTEADLFPDEEKKTMTVRLHNMASRMQDEAVRYLCEELNATETIYPGTDLRMIYTMVSSQIP